MALRCWGPPPHGITLHLQCWRRYDLLAQAVASALRGSLVPRRLIVVDDGHRMPAHIRRRIEESCRVARVFHPDMLYEIRTPDTAPEGGHGIRLHNAALAEFGDVLFANDDIEFYPSTIATMIEGVRGNPHGLLYATAERGGDWAGMYYVKAEILDIVGPLDEEFTGCGYCSDDDWRYRLELAGRPAVLIPGLHYGHKTSSTLIAKSAAEQAAHWEEFRRHREYYARKWGGPPHEETYSVPFGAGVA